MGTLVTSGGRGKSKGGGGVVFEWKDKGRGRMVRHWKIIHGVNLPSRGGSYLQLYFAKKQAGGKGWGRN